MSKGMPSLLTPAELKALRPVAAHAGGTVTLWGRQVPWRPLTVTIYDRFVISRFEAPRSFFVFTAQVSAAKEAIAEAEAKGVAPDPDLLRIVDGREYMGAQAGDGGAANMAFIAAGIGAPGNTEIEMQLLEASDEELEAALSTIEEGTWGDDPARFFVDVGRRLTGRTLSVLQTAKGTSPSPDSTSRTSTPTPSKARTPVNRKARRATKATGRKTA